MIRFKNISYTYEDASSKALNDINCDIEQGEFVYVTGASESGKTTFLKVISGQLHTDVGLLKVQSYITKQLKKRKSYLLKRQVGTVFRDFELLEHKTVYENVAYALEVLEYSTNKMEERALETLALVGMKYKALDAVSNCTFEERRRIALARAIVHEPAILIVDEITSGLKIKPKINMLNLLHKINKQGTSVIMATSQLELIDHMPARVIELEKGKIKRDRSKNHMLLILSSKMGEYYIS